MQILRCFKLDTNTQMPRNRKRHSEKTNDVDEHCFVSPVVITVTSDKSVKTALSSRLTKTKWNCMTMRPHMPIMEELLYHISVEKTRDCTVQQFISKIDLDYSYGQMKISEETSRQCVCAVTGGKFSGYYRFNKGFYGLAVIPTKFQGKSDWTLEYCTPALLDDIIVLTREDQQDHEKKLFEILNKLEKARYRPRYQKIQILHEQKMTWTRNRWKRCKRIIGSDKKSKATVQKSWSHSSVQYNTWQKCYQNYRNRQTVWESHLKRMNPWTQDTDFDRIKHMVTEGPCLAHYAKENDNMVTTDASKTGLGITLWQK